MKTRSLCVGAWSGSARREKRDRLRIVRIGPFCEMLWVLRSLLHDTDAVNAFDGRELGDKLVGCGGVEVEHGVGGVRRGPCS